MQNRKQRSVGKKSFFSGWFSSKKKDTTEAPILQPKPERPTLKRQPTLRKSTTRSEFMHRKSSKSYRVLNQALDDDGKHTPAIFRDQAVEAVRKRKLTTTEVQQLVKKAINNGYAEELDVLATQFGDVVSTDFIEQQLKQTKESQIFQNLLVCGAQGQLNTLAYVLQPESKFNVISQDNHAGLRKSYDDVRKGKVTIVVKEGQYDAEHEVLDMKRNPFEYTSKMLRYSQHNVNVTNIGQSTPTLDSSSLLKHHF